jgi:hypothetical protein
VIAFPLRSRSHTSHPFARRGVTLPRQGSSLHAVLLRVFLVRLAALLDRAKKMLLSDVCNRLTTRAPVDRLAPERVAFASPTVAAIGREPDTAFGAGPPCGNPAPGGARLTAQPQLRPYRPLRLSRHHGWEKSRATALWRSPRRRGVVDHVRRWRRTSGALCRTRIGPGVIQSLTRSAEDRSPAPLVKEVRPHCPERLPSTGCSQGSALTESFLREPATGISALPPLIRLPTSFRRPDALARCG